MYVKKGNTTEKMIASMRKLSESFVEVGHFREQGNHPTARSSQGVPITYVKLMKLHNDGTESILSRPVLPILEAKFSSMRLEPVRSGVEQFMKNPFGDTGLKGLLNSVGDYVAQEEKDIIGNPSELQVTTNPTPLLDTGELRDAVSYRNSLDRRIVNAT